MPKKHQPNFEAFHRAITSRTPGRVPVGELFADPEIIGAVLGETPVDYWGEVMLTDEITSKELDSIADRYVDQVLRFCQFTGWDYAYCSSVIPFKGLRSPEANESLPGERRKRFWVNDNEGPIQRWDDLERYEWPRDVERINLAARRMAQRVPDGMKVLVAPGGVFEWTTWLMGLVPFSYSLADQPDLVDAVISKVADTIMMAAADIITEPGVGGIFTGDDWGYASGTIVSQKIMREKFLPQTKRMVELAHKAGKLFILHSCGNMYALMDDLIDMGIDGKHSFEDKILPVEQAYQRYADRIAILGGVDMHILASGSEEQVRQRTRHILDFCGSGGHYVLGTGNSAASYIPLQNYLAMIEEGKRWNSLHFPRD